MKTPKEILKERGIIVAECNCDICKELEQKHIDAMQEYADQFRQADVSGSLQAEAIEFAEWIRTFDSLEKKQGFWIIESQISSEDLYKGFLKDRERWRNDR